MLILGSGVFPVIACVILSIMLMWFAPAVLTPFPVPFAISFVPSLSSVFTLVRNTRVEMLMPTAVLPPEIVTLPPTSTMMAWKSDSMPMLPPAVASNAPLFLLEIVLLDTATGSRPVTAVPLPLPPPASVSITVTSLASAWDRILPPAFSFALFVSMLTPRLNTPTFTVAPTDVPEEAPDTDRAPSTTRESDFARTLTLPAVDVMVAPAPGAFSSSDLLLSSSFTRVSDSVTSAPSAPATEEPLPELAEMEAITEINFSLSSALTLTSLPAVIRTSLLITVSVTDLLTITSSVPPTATLPLVPAALMEISIRSSSVSEITSRPSPEVISACGATRADALLFATITFRAPAPAFPSLASAMAAAIVNSCVDASTLAFWLYPPSALIVACFVSVSSACTTTSVPPPTLPPDFFVISSLPTTALTDSLVISSAISRPAAVLRASTLMLPSRPSTYRILPSLSFLTVPSSFFCVSPLVIVISAAPILALILLLKYTTAKEPAPVNFPSVPVFTAPEIASA